MQICLRNRCKAYSRLIVWPWEKNSNAQLHWNWKFCIESRLSRFFWARESFSNSSPVMIFYINVLILLACSRRYKQMWTLSSSANFRFFFDISNFLLTFCIQMVLLKEWIHFCTENLWIQLPLEYENLFSYKIRRFLSDPIDVPNSPASSLTFWQIINFPNVNIISWGLRLFWSRVIFSRLMISFKSDNQFVTLRTTLSVTFVNIETFPLKFLPVSLWSR